MTNGRASCYPQLSANRPPTGNVILHCPLSARARAQLSQAINEQFKVLSEHSTVLAQHSTVLAEHSRVLTEQSTVLAGHSRVLAEQSTAITELSKAVAALQGDVQVLLDRSDRASGGEVGTKQRNARYAIARQAVPTPRGDEEGGDEE